MVPRVTQFRGEAADEARAAFSALYGQLQRMARRQLGQADYTCLDTVALLHEAFLKLDGRVRYVEGDARFVALAGKAMRQVIANYLRERAAGKRGGGARAVTLVTGIAGDDSTSVDALDLEAGLAALEALDPGLVELVEAHFYAGLEFADIAALRGCSERTVYRDWQKARAFLHARLGAMA
jgi:RNA polymerase sigma factor (TIGR02999 family)